MPNNGLIEEEKSTNVSESLCNTMNEPNVCSDHDFCLEESQDHTSSSSSTFEYNSYKSDNDLSYCYNASDDESLEHTEDSFDLNNQQPDSADHWLSSGDEWPCDDEQSMVSDEEYPSDDEQTNNSEDELNNNNTPSTAPTDNEQSENENGPFMTRFY